MLKICTVRLPSLSLLTIVFIVLKLTGVIGWSWWWVLAPTWIPLVILLVCLIILGCIMYWALDP